VTSPNPFPPEVVAAVMRHMNSDHADDCRVICQGLGGQPGATAATMSGMDADGMDFVATVDGEPFAVRVPFSTRLAERRQIRAEAARMYRQACTALGVPPRPDAS
jgi:putative heme iron utilization protein